MSTLRRWPGIIVPRRALRPYPGTRPPGLSAAARSLPRRCGSMPPARPSTFPPSPPIADGKCEAHLIPAEFTAIEERLQRHDAVQRCQTETTARPQDETEVLGVHVGRPEQPVRHDGFDEEPLVVDGTVTGAKSARDLDEAGPSVDLVFLRRWDAARLTEILLRPPEQTTIRRPLPAEAPHHERPGRSESLDACLRDG